MKKLLFVFAATVFVLSIATMSYAQTSATYAATAAITSELRLTASVFQLDSKNTEDYTDDTWATTPSTSMSFGTLTHTLANGNEAGLLFSRPYYYVALLGAFTSGRKYRIQSSCNGLVGPVTISQGFGITVLDGDPENADHTKINSTPMAGTLGTIGTAVATNKLLYDSGSTGVSRVISATFGIPPRNTAGTMPAGLTPIPVDTASGSYSGNVIFSIVLY
jgi:hypothetical protein